MHIVEFTEYLHMRECYRVCLLVV